MNKNQEKLIDVYNVLVRCGNFDLFEKININYGTKIIDEKCPKCKCKTLHLIIR